MNEHDQRAKEIKRQSRPPMDGNPRNAANAAGASVPSVAPSTRVVDGQVQRLFLPDYDPLDTEGYYLGSEPLEEF